MNPMVVIVASIVLAALPLAAQQPPSQFEIASVRPTPDTSIRGLFSRCGSPNRWCGRSTLVQYIGVAYPEYKFEGRIVGGPSWIRNERFDIEALKDPSATTAAQIAPMMAHLLSERFALRTHVEQRLVDVYVLRMARADGRLGPQLKRSAASCIEAKMARQPPPPECRGSLSGVNRPVSQIAELVESFWFLQIDRPVLDRTGLTGYFDLQFHYDYGPFGGLVGTFLPLPRSGGVSLFTALEEQLGLKLEPTREMMDVLVIDSVERPATDQ